MFRQAVDCLSRINSSVAGGACETRYSDIVILPLNSDIKANALESKQQGWGQQDAIDIELIWKWSELASS